MVDWLKVKAGEIARKHFKNGFMSDEQRYAAYNMAEELLMEIAMLQKGIITNPPPVIGEDVEVTPEFEQELKDYFNRTSLEIKPPKFVEDFNNLHLQLQHDHISTLCSHAMRIVLHKDFGGGNVLYEAAVRFLIAEFTAETNPKVEVSSESVTTKR